MNEDLETIIKEVYSCYGVRYGNAIVDLKQRIDKAIEYIDRRDIDWGSEEHDKLVNILKGSDSNEKNIE